MAKLLLLLMGAVLAALPASAVTMSTPLSSLRGNTQACDRVKYKTSCKQRPDCVWNGHTTGCKDSAGCVAAYVLADKFVDEAYAAHKSSLTYIADEEEAKRVASHLKDDFPTAESCANNYEVLCGVTLEELFDNRAAAFAKAKDIYFARDECSFDEDFMEDCKERAEAALKLVSPLLDSAQELMNAYAPAPWPLTNHIKLLKLQAAILQDKAELNLQDVWTDHQWCQGWSDRAKNIIAV